jgi:hypothetical protein
MVRVGLVGIYYRIDGIKLTKASIIVEIAPILPPREGGSVNIAKLIMLKSHNGMNKVVNTVIGFLESGI